MLITIGAIKAGFAQVTKKIDGTWVHVFDTIAAMDKQHHLWHDIKEGALILQESIDILLRFHNSQEALSLARSFWRSTWRCEKLYTC